MVFKLKTLLLIVGLVGFAPLAWAGETTFEQTELTVTTAKGDVHLTVELAESPKQRARGLMYRQVLSQGKGMLFDFKKPIVVQMWMKNTYISLDMLFIDQQGTIINIAEKTVPHSTSIVSSVGPALAVLEIGGGQASRLNIKPGDVVRHPIFASGRNKKQK